MLSAYLTCTLLLAGTVQALDPNKRLTQYIHSSWRTQDGSAPSGMQTITQTSDGFLWFLSSSGEIYQFDGVQFRLWRRPADTDSVGKIRNIIADKVGGLWLLGAEGIAHLKHGVVFSHLELRGLMPNPLNISEDNDGSIWVVRGGNDISQPFCHVIEDMANCFGKRDGIPITPIDAILADGKGGFWLGGQTDLVHWRRDRLSETYPLNGVQANGAPGILSLARGPDGSVWVGIFSKGPGLGLARVEEGTVRSFVTPTFDGSKVVVFALRFDHDGNLWVGTEKDGVLRVHGNVVEHYARTEGLSGNFVRTFFEDREGIVWAATNNGIDNFHDPRVTSFSALEGLSQDSVVGILASKDGTIWAANSESLDHIVDDYVLSIRWPGQQVSSLLEDRAGNLWVGVNDGLYIFKAGRFRRLPESKGQRVGLIFGLIEDIEGNIWAYCFGDGSGKLLRIRDFRIQEEFSSSQVPLGRIAPDLHGGIWIGPRNGDLVLFRHGALQTFRTNSSAHTNEIIAQADGSVLAAFDDGLTSMQQGKVQRLTTKNGMPCDGVISFVEDNERRWWLNTPCGIVELSDSELQRWLANPQALIRTQVYDVLDGARISGRTPFNSAAVSPDGRVWFANSGVVEMLNPAKFSQEAPPAVTYIESLTVDRKEVPAIDSLKLSPHPRDLQIDYTSPTFLIPQRVKFRYRLDGYEHEWHEAGTRRQAFYTDLPPGRYSFRVMACNSDGVWNDRAAKLDFSIAPAYYQTKWFFALCAAVLLGLLWIGYRFRIRQLQREFNTAIDARVNERTRIARELHDTLLQDFQAISLKFHSVLKLLPERPMDARQRLEQALGRATVAITQARNAVHDLRSSAMRTTDLVQSITKIREEFTVDLPGAENADIDVRVEGTPRDLKSLVSESVNRIAGEALRNAFRHARALRISVQVQYGERQFLLRIRDNGKGFDQQTLDQPSNNGHFGIRGMRERAQVVGGQLEIWSKIDSGTAVNLSIPADKAYATPTRRSWLYQLLGRKFNTTQKES